MVAFRLIFSRFMILLIISSLLFGSISLVPKSVAAAGDPPDTFNIDADLSSISELTAGWAGDYYSRQTGVSYSSTSYNVNDYVTDPTRQSQISSVTLVSNATGITATCTTTSCTTNAGTLYGNEKDVISDPKSKPYSFDWWRNAAGGPRAFYWTYDSPSDGHTVDASPPNGTGGCDPNVSGYCAQLYPGGTYPDYTNLDASGTSWSFVDTGGAIDYSVVTTGELTNLSISGDINPDPSTFFSEPVSQGIAKFNFVAGAFDSGGLDIFPHAPDYPQAIGIRWRANFSGNMKGTTNLFHLKWTMTVSYTGGCTPGNPACTPSGTGDCPYIIGPPTQGTTMPLSDLDPNANGVIRADSRDSEKFNVLQGIPTSEY
ncbi:hypothetical protein, partial [Paenibacillus marchantiophytorum]|uniref:hypothetical protein n=1 Tax=Paenibacillus marchantiophytorum TaxID=1619310 RepID=UPI00166DD56A